MEIIMLKIANFVLDQKFIDHVITYHDILSSDAFHEYIFVSSDTNYSFEYIKNVERIKKISSDKIINHLIEEKFDAVFLHSFNVLPFKLISKIPANIKIFWFSWGYDIYLPLCNLIPQFIKINLYHSNTKKLLSSKKIFSIEFIKSFLRRYIKPKNLIKLLIDKRNIKKALRRIDYYSGVFDYEYDLVKKSKYIKAQRCSYSYINFTDTFENKINLNERKDIIIGNSADPSNNHTDLIPYLKNIDLENSKIILPLSYCEQDYAEKVINSYSNAFPERIIPLKTFLPLDEYNKIIGNCGISIFFHERQQAVGNIIEAFKYGNKIYMSETNKAFSYLKKLGFIIFSIQKDLNQSSFFTPLTKEEKLMNNSLVYKYWSKEKQLERLKNLYNQIHI